MTLPLSLCLCCYLGRLLVYLDQTCQEKPSEFKQTHMHLLYSCTKQTQSLDWSVNTRTDFDSHVALPKSLLPSPTICQLKLRFTFKLVVYYAHGNGCFGIVRWFFMYYSILLASQTPALFMSSTLKNKSKTSYCNTRTLLANQQLVCLFKGNAHSLTSSELCCYN